MAVITEAGIETRDLTGYLDLVRGALREAFGDDLNFAAETPQNQLAGVLALLYTESEELAGHVAAGMNRGRAVGLQLDDYGSLFSLGRIAGERSTVTATLTGTAGTIIPAGSRAKTTGGAIFASDAAATIAGGGSVDVLFRSVDIGPIAAAANELSALVDVVAGWTGITNAAAATLGRNRETDAEYRRRYEGEVTVHARDALEAIRARILEQAGVTDCLVRDNPTAADVTEQGIAIAARSMLAVVEGGANADIGAAIAAAKPLGVPMTGNITVQVPHAQGFNIAVSFRRVTAIPLSITVTTTVGAGFPANGLALMRANLAAWFAGTWEPGLGIFDTGGLGIGQALDTNRLLSPLNSVAGHTLASVVVVRTAMSAAIGTPELDERYTLAAGDITFTLN